MQVVFWGGGWRVSENQDLGPCTRKLGSQSKRHRALVIGFQWRQRNLCGIRDIMCGVLCGLKVVFDKNLLLKQTNRLTSQKNNKANCQRRSPKQSELCMKFSVFHNVFAVKFWWHLPLRTPKPWKTQHAENLALKFHAKFHDTFGREKQRKNSLFCRVASLTIEFSLHLSCCKVATLGVLEMGSLWTRGILSVNSPALILSKNSGVFLAKIG